MEYELGGVPGRRLSSWYDYNLVVDAGEKILSVHDTRGIAALRAAGLIWSSWGPTNSLATDDYEKIGGPYGIRTVKSADIKSMRLLYLSIIWRAAASNIKSCREISLQPSDMSVLKKMVLESNYEPVSHFPVYIFQISTRGIRHNLAPAKMTMSSSDGTMLPFFRIYFDGLVAHIGTTANDNRFLRHAGKMVLGTHEHLHAMTVTYEASSQKENIEAAWYEANGKWSERMQRISR